MKRENTRTRWLCRALFSWKAFDLSGYTLPVLSTWWKWNTKLRPEFNERFDRSH